MNFLKKLGVSCYINAVAPYPRVHVPYNRELDECWIQHR